MRPVGDAGDETVLDRIDVDVIDVTGEVVVVAYRMFPVTPLPKTVFATCISNEGKACGHDRAGEMAFYAAPAVGVVSIVLGKSEDGVQMVGQDDDGVNVERGGGFR